MQTVTCDVVAIFATRSLALALSLDQGDSPPATAAHLLPLKFVACHPTRLYTPNRFPTSYCCSPAAFVSCHPTSLDQENLSPATAAHLLPLKFVACHPTRLYTPNRFPTSYCCSPAAFVSCHPTSLDQENLSPATAAHLLPLKFASCHPTSLDQADSLTSCCCSFTPFVPCHSTSLARQISHQLLLLICTLSESFGKNHGTLSLEKNQRHATKLARIVAREMSLRGKVVAATHRLVCKGP